MKYVYPKTLNGWKTLLWLSMGRCPIHHSVLSVDSPIYDNGRTAYCFSCHGIGVWPQGIREALRQNTLAAEQKKT